MKIRKTLKSLYMIFRQNWDMILSVGLAIFTFFYCFGLKALLPSNTGFVTVGGDFSVSYLGSAFYRSDAWHWPPLVHTNLAYPYGISVHGTDGSPLLSFIFKLLTTIFGISPELQFVGLWTLISFILQSIAAVLIFRLFFKEKRFFVFIASIFILFAPIMWLRIFVHINLMNQFVLLFGIYILLRKRLTKRDWLYMNILLFLGMYTCPYFIPMLLGLFFILIYDKLIKEKAISYKSAFIGLISFAICLLVSFYLLGMLSTGQILADGGWRGLGLNIMGLFNPVWGIPRFLTKVVKNADFDADNYFGLGQILMLFLTLPAILKLCTFKNIAGHKAWGFVIIGWIIFALSPTVKFNEIVIINYNPGPVLEWIGAVFRYSGRMFWPVWYLLSIFVITQTVEILKKKSYIILPLLLAIQLWDLYPIITSKINFIKNAPTTYETKLVSSEWDRLNAQYQNIFIFEHNENYREIWLWAIKHHKNVNYGFLNRASTKTKDLVAKTREELNSGFISDPSYFYVIDGKTEKNLILIAKNNPMVADLISKIKIIDNYKILEYNQELYNNHRSFQGQSIHLKHDYWDSVLILVSPNRLYRKVDGRKDYATIVEQDEKHIVLKWDNYGVESFYKENGVFSLKR